MKYALYNTNLNCFLTSGSLSAITGSKGSTDPFDAKLYNTLHVATAQGRSLLIQYQRKVKAGLIPENENTVPALIIKEITIDISNSFVLTSA